MAVEVSRVANVGLSRRAVSTQFANLTGVLLIGGASRRFGSPKALATVNGESLGERAWNLLGLACEKRIAVGKAADALPYGFEIVDDGTPVRAALAGVVAGLRHAETELCVIVPVDCPMLTVEAIHQLARACRDAAVSGNGPLPGAYNRRALPVLERRLAANELRLRDALTELDVGIVDLPDNVLLNVNSPGDLDAARELIERVPYGAAEVGVVRHPGTRQESDFVAVEEPLEIRISGKPVAVTMRTPGNDEELALGFAIGEGIEPISAALPADLAANTVELEVRSFDEERVRRNFYTSSSCGVCGKGALGAVAVHAAPIESRRTVDSGLLAGLPERLRAAQPTFVLTGGLHAAGLFDWQGELLCVREDVGRHNALDKVVGWAFTSGLLPLGDSILCLSGRLSFELVQKAAVAGCPVLVGVGAPSSLAIELAQAQGITLCGFVRADRVSAYACPERLM